MRIAVLTSSRADYGIYHPLLKAMANDSYFDLRLIVFGTHLSSFHGYTIESIREDGFVIDCSIEHILSSDSKEAIATSMGLAFIKFASFWEKSKELYDLVFCLGDRYEMFAAVSAATPFGIRFAHFHGGETTLGAIDNEYRHSITLFSEFHFTSTDSYADRVAQILGHSRKIYSVGSLSLDDLNDIELMSTEELSSRFSFDITIPTILVTFHPETVAPEENERHARELMEALVTFNNYQILVTMPNADTHGNRMRRIYKEFATKNSSVILVESLGRLGYFSCLKHCAIVAGNSSSGIIEAASFGKYVVNVGNRQNGRAVSDNVINCANQRNEISASIEKGLSLGYYAGSNVYYKPSVAQQIIQVLKNEFQ